jgi:hypothetical protein
MYSRRGMVRQALEVALLFILVLLAVCACGGGEEEADRPRPLPEEEKPLRPGEYRSEEFKPSFSFRVGKGWQNVPPEAADMLTIRRVHETGGVGFANIRELYKPTRTGTPNVVDATKDLVSWFQRHSYLQTSKPESVAVGGEKGKRLDVVVENLPEDHPSVCGSDCVDIAKLSTGEQAFLGKDISSAS